MQEQLYIKLFQLRRRQTLVQAVESGIRFGMWAAWASLPVLILFIILRLPLESQLHALWLWPAGALAGILHGLLSPLSLRQIAHRTDQAHGLQERLLTCLGHLQSQAPQTALSQMLLQETLGRLEHIDPRQTFVATWKRPLLRWLVPALALLAAILLTPRWLPPPPADPLEQELLASQRRLSRLSQKLARRGSTSAEQKKLQQLLKNLPRQVPAQAARQLRQQLRATQRQMAEQSAQAQELARLAEGALQSPAERKQLQQLRQQVQQSQASQKLEQAQKALEQGNREAARQALRQAQEQLSQDPEAQEQGQIAQALQDELGQLDPRQGAGDGQNNSGTETEIPQAAPGGKSQKKGPVQADFGEGTTNQQGKTGQAARPKLQSPRQNPQTREKQEQFRQLYGSERSHFRTRKERLALKGSKGKLLRMSDSRLGEARTDLPSLRPEESDFLAAKAQAEQSVTEEQIPAEHREAVRRYFDRIDPREAFHP